MAKKHIKIEDLEANVTSGLSEEELRRINGGYSFSLSLVNDDGQLGIVADNGSAFTSSSLLNTKYFFPNVPGSDG